MGSILFDPNNILGAVNPPIFKTSTYASQSAQALKTKFEILVGLRKPDDMRPEDLLIYGRFESCNSIIFQREMVVLEKGATGALVFNTGMAAITLAIRALVKPGQKIVYTNPVYGCTETFFSTICKEENRQAIAVDTSSLKDVETVLKKHGSEIAVIYIETPANPNLVMTNIKAIVELARKYEGAGHKINVVVDNTFMGIFQQPFLFGVDVVIYSATKFLGGHSDLIGGVVLTKDPQLLILIKSRRDVEGNIMSPDVCSLVSRSLPTLELRMKAQAKSAQALVEYLAVHPKVESVIYPSLLKAGDPQYDIYREQCSSPGSMITFYLKDADTTASFRFLDALKHFLNAVSLGGVECLACNPNSTTHLAVDEAKKQSVNVTANMIRLSIGLIEPNNLITDVENALKAV